MKTAAPRKETRLVVGGEARVELLPPEVAARARTRSTRRALVGVVVLAGLVCAGGYGLASVTANASAAELAAAQDRTRSLLQQQGEFIEVQLVQNQLHTATAARQVGSSTEITWQGYLLEVQDSLPEGIRLTGFIVDSSTPLQPHAQAAAPLQGERVATLNFTASSPTIPNVEAWLDGLVGVTGFVDATPGSISQDEESGGYDVTMTMHIDSRAYANRFAQDADTATEESSQ